MSEFVVDASAIVALYNGESGYQAVNEIRLVSLVSTINITEALSRLIRIDVTPQDARAFLNQGFPYAVAFDREQAELAGILHAEVRRWGLSYADCACIALGKLRDKTIVTGDRKWKELDLGVRIRLFR